MRHGPLVDDGTQSRTVLRGQIAATDRLLGGFVDQNLHQLSAVDRPAVEPEAVTTTAAIGAVLRQRDCWRMVVQFAKRPLPQAAGKPTKP